MLFLLYYLWFIAVVGGAEETTFQRAHTFSSFLKYFWLTLPEHFCTEVDGLYIMQKPGILTHFKDGKNTTISYQEKDECWYLVHEGATKQLRSCRLSYPSHPPEEGWVICYDATCDNIKDYRGQVRLQPMSEDFSNQLSNPSPEISINLISHHNCSWTKSSKRPKLCQEKLHQMNGIYTLSTTREVYPVYQDTDNNNTRYIKVSQIKVKNVACGITGFMKDLAGHGSS